MHLIEKWRYEVDIFALKFCNLLYPYSYFTIFYNESKWGSFKVMIEKILPFMLCRFSNDFFALKKCHILHIENL